MSLPYKQKKRERCEKWSIREKVLNGKELSEAFDEGLKNIHQCLPYFAIEKEDFLKEFEKLRTQIS